MTDKSKNEPVAWGMEGKDGFIYDVICPAEHEREEGGYTTPLYTTPQPRTWKELTKGEIESWVIPENLTLVEFVWFVETKIRELNDPQ